MRKAVSLLTKRLLGSLLLSAFLVGGVQAADKVRVLMSTSLGDIELELDRKRAPLSVENFLTYMEDGFYNGTIFHRVIENFMIQGGGFTVSMEKKPTRAAIQNEAKNGMKNQRGTIAMARTRDPHSASSQFYINHADNSNLDFPSYDNWGYAVFGEVVKGMEVVDAIAKEKTGPQAGMMNVPNMPIIINNMVACPAEGCPSTSAPALLPADDTSTR